MLRQRVITALSIGLPLLAVLFWLPKMVTVLIFAVAVLQGAREWTGFLQLQTRWSQLAYVALIAVAMWASWHYIATPSTLNGLLLCTLTWWLVALLWIVCCPQRQSRLLTGLAGLWVLVPAWLSLSLLYRQEAGAQWVLLLLLLVVGTDIGGFLAGRRWGHTKLAPHVSPGKTWEGVAGGVTLSTAIAVIGAIGFGVQIWPFLLLCWLTVAISVVGDLTESLFKRQAGLKDSGTLLPGHGGILDRIDSTTAAAPLFLYGLILLDVLSA